MNLTDVLASFQREYRLLIKNKVNLLLSILPPTIYMLLFATSISNVIPHIIYQGQRVPYHSFIIPAILLMAMIAGATTTATSLFQEEAGGMLLELWSYPIRKSSYIIGKLLSTTLLVCLQGVAMLLVALLLFWRDWSSLHIYTLLLGMLCTSLSLNSIYLFLATQFRDQQIFIVTINTLAPILLFSSPSFYEYEQMPVVIQYFSMINPVTYGINALRDGLLFGLSHNWNTLLLLLTISGVGGAATTYALLGRFRDL